MCSSSIYSGNLAQTNFKLLFAVFFFFVVFCFLFSSSYQIANSRESILFCCMIANNVKITITIKMNQAV